MAATRKRVLMLIPNLGFGGAERSFAKLSLLLAERHDVFVAVFNQDSYTEQRYEHGGTFIDLEVSTGPGVLKKASAFLERVRKVKAIKKEKKIDVCISFLEGADYINILSRQREKTILSIRGSKKYDNNISGLIGKLRKEVLIPYLYNRADIIVTVNDGITDELRNVFHIKSRVNIVKIYNFYDVGQLVEKSLVHLDEKTASLFEGRIIISHGRLSAEKGYQYLIPVIGKLVKTYPELKLVLIGEGNYTNHLKTICVENEIAYSDDGSHKGNVIFWGFESNPLKFLSRSTIFVLSSFTEGFPNAIVEAMIAKVPVVSADCPWGPRDILEGIPLQGDILDFNKIEYTKTGVLLPLLSNADAENKWLTALSALLQNVEMRDGMVIKASERVHDFSTDAIVTKWYEIIDS